MNIWGIGKTINIWIDDPLYGAYVLTSDADNPTPLPFIKIELSIDGGENWTTIEANYANTTGYYSWVIHDSASLNCYIRISDPNDAENSGIGALFGIGPVESGQGGMSLSMSLSL